MKLSRYYHNGTAHARTLTYEEYLALCLEHGHKPQTNRQDWDDSYATKGKLATGIKHGKVGRHV